MRQVCIVFVLLSTLACSQKPEEINSTLFLKAKELGEVIHPKLSEVSGVAASVTNPGLLWMHNDSGNEAEVYLVDQQMNLKLTCKLKDIVNRDWEDITVGPGPEPGKSYIYVGDIGDNLAIFQFKNIYRFEEPVIKDDESEITISDFDVITFQLQGTKKDTEAMMIDPKSKNLYIISKWEKPESVYEIKYPYSAKDTVTAKLLLTIPFSRIVAADFSSDGNEILMKSYQNVYHWQLKGRSVKEALKESPSIVEYKEEPQGEAITFVRDGSGFFTISEKNKKHRTYLNFYERTTEK